jgi:S-adenosylmethionine:diacylglycerol 3-amino-3-carboxypropyl transferase
MNERINELEDQASQYASRETTDLDEWEFIFRKKFAELIVKECMTMSDELKAQYLTSRKSTMDFDEKNIYAEGEAACDVLKYKMKKHFGVEQ